MVSVVLVVMVVVEMVTDVVMVVVVLVVVVVGWIINFGLFMDFGNRQMDKLTDIYSSSVTFAAFF